MNILIRADGSHLRGMGHLSKMATLSRLLEREGHKVYFLCQEDETAKNFLQQRGVPATFFKSNESDATVAHIHQYGIDLVILDILNTSGEYVSALKTTGVYLVTFDNTDASAFMCDLIFNVMYYHAPEDIPTNSQDTLFEGPMYVIMEPGFQKTLTPQPQDSVSTILITQGGADTTGRTEFLIRCAKQAIGKRMTELHVVIGPAFDPKNIETIESLASRLPGIILHYRPLGLQPLIDRASMVISAGGTTMWEVCARNRPLYVYTNEPFEEETATVLKKQGLCLYDGHNAPMEQVAASLHTLIEQATIRKQLIDRTVELDIGSGSNRVLSILKQRFLNV